jgi:hypothetical protein
LGFLGFGRSNSGKPCRFSIFRSESR